MIDLVQSGTLVAVFSSAAVAIRIALKAVIVVWSFKGTKSDRQHALALLRALNAKKDAAPDLPKPPDHAGKTVPRPIPNNAIQQNKGPGPQSRQSGPPKSSHRRTIRISSRR